METASIESSKRLHELRWRGECKLEWREHKFGGAHISESHIWLDTACYERYPAPTFTELWAALPDELPLDGCEEARLFQDKHNGETRIGYDALFIAYNESPTEAAVQLLIWLIENNHVTVNGG